MNYAAARQVDPSADRPDAGKWRWSVANDGRVRPDGACSPVEVCPECHGWSGIVRPDVTCEHCGSCGLVDVANPCPGHDTKEEAEEHFREYQIANAEFHAIDNAKASGLYRCKVQGCEIFTASYMTIKGDSYRHDIVCPAHHTRATAEQLIGRTSMYMYS